MEHWRARLPLDRGRLNVGLVWAGGHPRAERPADNRAGKSYLRNVPVAALGPLARVPGVRWFALQKGDNEDDPAPPGMDLLRLGPSLRDFGDTAAVASLLDVIVTVDTSVANLIGGLGLPGLVLLPKVADWRWMTGPDRRRPGSRPSNSFARSITATGPPPSRRLPMRSAGSPRAAPSSRRTSARCRCAA